MELHPLYGTPCWQSGEIATPEIVILNRVAAICTRTAERLAALVAADLMAREAILDQLRSGRVGGGTKSCAVCTCDARACNTDATALVNAPYA